MRQTPKRGGEVFWPMIVLKKWLNIRANNSEFSADEGGIDSELDNDEEYCGCEGKQQRSNRSGLEAVTNDGVSA